VGVREGVEVWVGDFSGVMVGDGVRVFVVVGLKVFVGSKGMTGDEVFVGTGNVRVLAISSVVTPSVSSVLADFSSVGAAGGLQAVTRMIITAHWKSRLPILFRRFGIELRQVISNLDRSIR
jgi:hypothetical protein